MTTVLVSAQLLWMRCVNKISSRWTMMADGRDDFWRFYIHFGCWCLTCVCVCLCLLLLLLLLLFCSFSSLNDCLSLLMLMLGTRPQYAQYYLIVDVGIVHKLTYEALCVNKMPCSRSALVSWNFFSPAAELNSLYS